MAEFSVTTVVAASPERVFELWTDLDRLREWIGGVARVTDRTGPLDEPGAEYTVWFGRMPSRTTVLDVHRPHHLRTRFGHLLFKGESDVEFSPEGAGTRIRQVIRTSGLTSAILGRIFATGAYPGSFRGELERFRQLAESPG